MTNYDYPLLVCISCIRYCKSRYPHQVEGKNSLEIFDFVVIFSFNTFGNNLIEIVFIFCLSATVSYL